MKVDAELVSEMGLIMKLAFSEEETETLVVELNQTLEMLASLEEVDTENVEGTFYGREGAAALREDVAVEKPEEVKALLEQTKGNKDGFIEVPAMLDDGEAGA